MAGPAGGVGSIGVTEVHIAANAIAIPRSALSRSTSPPALISILTRSLICGWRWTIVRQAGATRGL